MKPSLLLQIAAAVTLMGCAPNSTGTPDDDSYWGLQWRGRTTNLYGSEQRVDQEDAMSILAPFVERWSDPSGTTIAICTGLHSPLIMLRFASTAEGGFAALDGNTTNGSLVATLMYVNAFECIETLQVAAQALRSEATQDARIEARIDLHGSASCHFSDDSRLIRLELHLESQDPTPLQASRYDRWDPRIRANRGDSKDWYELRRRSPDRQRVKIHGVVTGRWFRRMDWL